MDKLSWSSDSLGYRESREHPTESCPISDAHCFPYPTLREYNREQHRLLKNVRASISRRTIRVKGGWVLHQGNRI